jgi:hypothetical protein
MQAGSKDAKDMDDRSANPTIEEVPKDTMRLTSHVISRVGFGVRLLWPDENPDEKKTDKDGYLAAMSHLRTLDEF